MSATISTIISNVRTQLKDTNASDYVIGSSRMLHKVTTQVMDVAGRLNFSVAWVTGLVTLAADDYDYALDNTYEYASILAVRRASDRMMLDRIPPEVLETYRQGDVVGVGTPDRYALLGAGDATAAAVETLTMLVYPTPTSTDAGDTLDALVCYEPTNAATTDVIPFTARAIRAIELAVMASCVIDMDEEAMAKLRIPQGVAGMYDSEAEQLLKLEETRIYRRTRPSTVAQTQVY